MSTRSRRTLHTMERWPLGGLSAKLLSAERVKPVKRLRIFWQAIPLEISATNVINPDRSYAVRLDAFNVELHSNSSIHYHLTMHTVCWIVALSGYTLIWSTIYTAIFTVWSSKVQLFTCQSKWETPGVVTCYEWLEQVTAKLLGQKISEIPLRKRIRNENDEMLTLVWKKASP